MQNHSNPREAPVSTQSIPMPGIPRGLRFQLSDSCVLQSIKKQIVLRFGSLLLGTLFFQKLGRTYTLARVRPPVLNRDNHKFGRIRGTDMDSGDD